LKYLLFLWLTLLGRDAEHLLLLLRGSGCLLLLLLLEMRLVDGQQLCLVGLSVGGAERHLGGGWHHQRGHGQHFPAGSVVLVLLRCEICTFCG